MSKERFNHRKEKEEISTDYGQWLLQMEEKFLRVEES
jgi:hypothetical protein